MPRKNLVYFVNDCLDDVKAFQSTFSEFHHDAVGFTEPSACLEASLNQAPNLYIIKITLPNISGFEFYKKVQDTHKLTRTPCLFISESHSSEEANTVYDFDQAVYLPKPYSTLELVKKVITTLNRQQKMIKLEDRVIKTKDTAFKAMNDVQLMQTTLDFVNSIHQYHEPKMIAEKVFETLNQLDIVSSIYFKILEEHHFFTTDHVERPMEQQLLYNFVESLPTFINKTGRFKEFNGRMIVTFEHTALLMKNYQDICEKDQLDFIASLLNNVNNRISEIEKDHLAQSKRESEIKNIVALSYQNLEDLNKLFSNYEKKIVQTVDNMLTQMNVEFNQLDLIEEEEVRLTNIISTTMGNLTETISQGIDLDQRFQMMVEKFERLFSENNQ